MKPTPEVKRVIAQIVEASCNSFARMMLVRIRAMMVDEAPSFSVDVYDSLRAAGYGAGRNDALRDLAKFLEDRLERQGLIEETARDVHVIVEANNG